jgi:small subunit ribosomal protein S4|uniref:Small ribosomal subunit protein uS4c n=1 Tax=Pseudochloris wilhelmii TaxID=1418016 RepID=A0A097KQU3_9CHLO|nr:ribosomal protein S4 [Pseudochloris wilhelmii]YP_009106737.1 ribosomal protein S4 [Pseudochloris wilhelmii]AIT95539.1 ribosomal protein S4 [Pseudochloris wilhelmii]AIT95553.1 ribosomal protein S4 [Pseudochloris wilhelmii]
MHFASGNGHVVNGSSSLIRTTSIHNGIFIKFMARYRGPRVRLVRRLGELPGLTQKSCTRMFPPGQHGPKKKLVGKESQYAIRLKEKQKLRFNYGISERQLIRYVREARRLKGSTGDLLLQLLEMRLDNIVFRLGFARTIAAARQLITHGHIIVNSQKVSIPSYLCKQNDIISVVETSRSLVQDNIKRFSGQRQLVSPHLNMNQTALQGTVTNVVPRDAVGIPINELLVVEYYSRKL